MANMLRGFWPSGPGDQTTPKASNYSSEGDRNPFDALAAAQASKGGSGAGTAPSAAAAGPGPAGDSSLSSLSAGLGHGDASGSTSASAGADSIAAPPGVPQLSQQQQQQLRSGELTPGGLRTPGGVMSQANIPTTSLSTTGEFVSLCPYLAHRRIATSRELTSSPTTRPLAPDFTMTLPPKKQQSKEGEAAAPVDAPTPASAAAGVNGSSDASTSSPARGTPAAAASGASTAASTAATSSTSGGASSEKGPTRNTTAPRGHLTIKVISARNLRASNPASRPYAVVSFDKNEFIGREPMDEAEIAAAAAGSGSSGADEEPRNGLPNGTFGDGPTSRTRAGTVTPSREGSSGSGGAARTNSGSGNDSAYNPVWKHEVKFDVTHENQAIFISVYDRHAEDEGFLGMRQIKPRLFHKMSSDQWYPLTGREEFADGGSNLDVTQPVSRGEIRIQISYEKTAQRKLTPADFEYMKLIGRGTFGRVFQVRKKDTKRIYAMKVLSKREIAIKKEVTHTMGERRILEKSLDCPFLVGLKFSFQSDTELFFVTDYKSGGELFWHLQREGRFTEDRARFYIAELVLALEHLHKYNIVYRDLKPENILLDATGHVALCDFGLSKPDLGNGQLTNTFCGTTEYLAPEVLLDESGYSKLVDFWSLGV